MTNIFISYSRSDRDLIAAIKAEIELAGFMCWLDESNILAATEFDEKIVEGLQSCQWFLIVMSPRSADSEYVKDELHWALSNRNGRVLPVMIEQVDPAKFHLRMLRIQYANCTQPGPKRFEPLTRTLQTVVAASADYQLLTQPTTIGNELELISLLLTFIARNDQKHLRNLLRDSGVNRLSYTGHRAVRHELRDLCTWGLISRKPDVKLGECAADGRTFLLSEVVQLTELGRRIAPHIA